MGVELPLRVVVTILECCVTFSGVKLSNKIVCFIYLITGRIQIESKVSNRILFVLAVVYEQCYNE